MALYDYQCSECKEIFEVNQSVHDEPLKDCPKCKSKDSLQRLIGSSYFHLKGGGWASQGYHKKK